MTDHPSMSLTSTRANDGCEAHAFADGRTCFKELVRSVNLFAVMFNSNAKLIYCNGHFVQMTGLSPDEVLGHNWNEIFVSPWEGYLPNPFGEWLNNKPEALHHEGELLTREGERYWVRWNSIPVRDTRGTIVGIASLGEDLTERRRPLCLTKALQWGETW
jgi:PAS domain S-box-containing protein